jgi:hypothetical protein
MHCTALEYVMFSMDACASLFVRSPTFLLTMLYRLNAAYGAGGFPAWYVHAD